MKKSKVRRRRRRHRMKALTDEIMNCLAKGLWHAALILTLTMPDVCAALESADGFSNPNRYKIWYDRWLKAKYDNVGVTSDDIYYLRCGLAHQGRLGHRGLKFKRIFFTLRSRDGFFAHCNIFDGALNLDLLMFCNDMIDAVNAWFADGQKNKSVKKNLGQLIQYRQHGFTQIIPGVDIPTIE